MCCAYGTDGLKTAQGFDCVVIPGASSFLNKEQTPNSICGKSMGLITNVATGAAKTV